MKQKRSSQKMLMDKFGKQSKGSITLEASFLIPILLVIILMLVFLMLFYYNKITVWKNTYYIGIKLAEAKKEGIVYDLEAEWNKISKNTLVLPEDIEVSQKKVADSATVVGKINFAIPFWGKVEIKEKSTVPLCSNKERLARSKLWKN